MVPPPPEISGPIEGAGKSKLENLKELVMQEKEQLVSMQREVITMTKLIEYHSHMVQIAAQEEQHHHH
jgi:hypothetical protein